MPVGVEWMIRHQGGWIRGPFSQETVLQLIRSQALQLEDEVSSSEVDWFFLYEKDLAQRHLGATLPSLTGASPLNREEKTDPLWSPHPLRFQKGFPFLKKKYLGLSPVGWVLVCFSLPFFWFLASWGVGTWLELRTRNGGHF